MAGRLMQVNLHINQELSQLSLKDSSPLVEVEDVASGLMHCPTVCPEQNKNLLTYVKQNMLSQKKKYTCICICSDLSWSTLFAGSNDHFELLVTYVMMN